MNDADVKGVTVRHLEIFRAIMEAGSARMAAKRLGITQSAVSQALKHLEHLTKTSLFDRTDYRLVATGPANRLYRLTNQLFYEVNRVEDVVSEAVSEERLVSIGVPHILGLTLIPQVVNSASRSDKNTIYKIAAGHYSEIVDRVISGQIQLGIARLPLDPQLLDWKPLSSARSICLLHPGHRLTEKDHVSITDLAGERLIAIERQHASAHMGSKSALYTMVEPDISIYFDAIGHEIAFVAQGNGVAVTNSFIASQCHAFDVVSRPFLPSGSYEYVIIWRKGRVLSNKAMDVIEAIFEAVNRPH
ncbi:LysR family transcriptional regulator [Rhizobium lusitanum]|uniref:LysR family transcriptional regulator n=1 Tax=Rhizobium lusitanum TaxID=293958 RepID=A0A6L9UF49_9HYPH|nr:LysR family transcriptional regulator [Rhizobium lusitanum]NEI73969.1 LysR family transcriptional regulator [Rhizobium lusitanum]